MNYTIEKLREENEHGKNSLHLAVLRGKLKKVKSLILNYKINNLSVDQPVFYTYGIDEPNCFDQVRGNTALTIAAFICNCKAPHDYEGWVKYKKIIKLLIDAGADINYKNEINMSPLDYLLNTPESE